MTVSPMATPTRQMHHLVRCILGFTSIHLRVCLRLRGRRASRWRKPRPGDAAGPAGQQRQHEQQQPGRWAGQWRGAAAACMAAHRPRARAE